MFVSQLSPREFLFCNVNPPISIQPQCVSEVIVYKLQKSQFHNFGANAHPLNLRLTILKYVKFGWILQSRNEYLLLEKKQKKCAYQFFIFIFHLKPCSDTVSSIKESSSLPLLCEIMNENADKIDWDKDDDIRCNLLPLCEEF